MKIVCVGRNYSEHAKELSNDVPTEPVIFLKPATALLFAGAPFAYPDFSTDIHYEAELVFRIGRGGKDIPESSALEHVDAVTVGLDFTARDLQSKQKKAGLPWEIAKAFDGSAVVGKWIPLPSDVADVRFSLLMNGDVVQQGHSADMLFAVPEVIAYASRFFTLQPGDLIFTGTPAGVGPVKRGDVLDGFLEGEGVFSLIIQ